MTLFYKVLFYMGMLIAASVIAFGGLYTWQEANLEGTYNPQKHQPDCAVVFGAAVWPSGNPSAALRDRMLSAIEWAQKHKSSCLILSGGGYDNTRPHEVSVMRKMALNRGIRASSIIEDRAGLNTMLSVKNLDKQKSYLLISNDFHLARIRLLAWRLGIKGYTYPAKYYSQRYTKEKQFKLREIAAFAYYVFAPLARK